MDRREWAERMIQALLEAGVDLQDAERVVQWALDRVPPGADPQRWTPTLDQLLEHVAYDEVIRDARADWYVSDSVPPRFKRLLDAREIEEGERRRRIAAIGGLIAYFLLRGRYISAETGKPVARRDITGLLEAHVNAQEARMAEETIAALEGRIAPGVWLRQSQLRLRRIYVQNHALGLGGFRRFTPDDLATINQRLQEQYRFLAGFAQDIADGAVTEAQALNRIHMYLGNARRQFWEAEREAARPSGPDVTVLERRVLGVAEHCDDCVRLHGLGWQLAGTLPVPSEGSACDGNCRCTLVRREVLASDAHAWIGTRR